MSNDLERREFPKSYRENLDWRLRLLRRAKSDSMFRAAVVDLFHRDVLFAFNAFFYTLDVRQRPEHHQPFATYLYQDEAILGLEEAIDKGEDILFEKSRDMGCTYLVLGVLLHKWWNPSGGGDFLLGSRIEDYVDKRGDMRALFPKLRYMFLKTPAWLWPRGFYPRKHDNFMKWENPATGSVISGESNNPNFSTGGRYAAAMFDEFAKWESTDEAAWTAAGDATPCRIALSTPFGAAGKYYGLVTDGKTKRVTLHWTRHPKKAEGAYCPVPQERGDIGLEAKIRSPWYDAEVLRRSKLEISQELDINYIGSGNPVFDGKAQERIQELISLNRRPVAWYVLDMATQKLSSVIEPRDADGYFQVWEEPINSVQYTLGADVAEGLTGGDYSVVKVYRRDTKSFVASYYSQIDEVQFAKVIVAMAKYYGTPWVGIETNGPGLATFDLCAAEDLENLFMMPRYDTANASVSFRKGWRTDTTSRNMLIAGVREWLQAALGFVDARCCREMQTFVRGARGKAEAKAGCHDDEVISAGIAVQLDELCPLDEPKVERKLRDDGAPVEIFSLKPVEEPTQEERCLLQAIASHGLAEQRARNEEMLDLYSGELEEDW